jgi:hypothetical protein
MSVGRFDRKIELPSQGKITVEGPFNPQDRSVTSGRVLFMIVQGEGQDAVMVEGEGGWEKGDRNWSAKVSRRGTHVGDGSPGDLQLGLARGIALSIVIKPGKVFGGGSKFDPPSIEALTWCADFTFV